MRIRSGIVRIVGGRFEEGVNGKLFLDDRDYNSFILSFFRFLFGASVCFCFSCVDAFSK